MGLGGAVSCSFSGVPIDAPGIVDACGLGSERAEKLEPCV